MSVSRRPSAVPRRARDPIVYEHTSGTTDSRRSSRKDYSPRCHISTPGSKRSSHTTVSDSDEESTWTPDTQEDERGRVAVERYRAPAKRERPQREPRRSRERYSRGLKVPLVPEVVEPEEEDDESSEEEQDEEEVEEDEDDDDEDDEDESENEYTEGEGEEEEEEAATEPRLRARLRGHHIDAAEIPSRSPSSHRYPASRTRDRLRDAPRSEDHYRPQYSRRSPRRTHGSDIVHAKHPSIRRSNTTGGSHAPSALTISTRRSSLIDTFLPRSTRTTYERVKIATCVVCLDELPALKTAKLGCGHRMCNSCLKRSFKLSVADPQHMPPRCCTHDHIPLEHVNHLFDLNFKKTWNRKFIEHSTRNRLYCPSRRCGAWIQPENIYKEHGRKCGRCSRCRTKVCGACNGKWHSSRECPRDEATDQILEQAKDQGWQRCYRCRAMVELKEGCNHMICRCGAQFCMICGEKWKTCECPWFNYVTMEPEDFDHIPMPTPSHSETLPMSPPSRLYRGGELPTARPTVLRMHDFEETPVGPAQRRRDRDLARRFERPAARGSHHRDRDPPRARERKSIQDAVQEALIDDDYDYDDGDYDDDGYDLDEDRDYRGSAGDDRGLGSRRRTRGHDSFRRREETVVPSPPPTVPHGYDRTARTVDYISDLSKARRVRGSSMERRLADRFSPQRATQGAPLPQSPIHGPPHHPQQGLPPMSPMMAVPPPPQRPVAPAAPAPLRRRHTTEEAAYNMPRTRPLERVVPSRPRHDYVEEVPVRAPPTRRHSDELMAAKSTMAGLTGAGRGLNRVYEWRNYVEPGYPEDEQPPARRRVPF